ncbi:MAG: tRNA (guanosine(37)-N1)-methyltransferase TrmD [Vampirovibrionales bacterium]|nr:tRNA (guanosine(37)-N1)-methyltransferase TrmD [Vampirovibrionales bacterium]
MKFSVLTLFPDIITHYVSQSIIGRAKTAGVIEVEALNPRDYTTDPHRKVDDSPYGGGSGMVLACQPVEAAFESLLPLAAPARVLMTSPAGRRFDHRLALELSAAKQVVILCGHYEGFDERIKDLLPGLSGLPLEEVSMGDYVLTGGELPALSIIDAVTRLLPGGVQKFTSVENDSFYNGLLDYPHYTRPADYKGYAVPDVLLSGNHPAIGQWRKAQALERTQKHRPDLLP